MAKRKDKDAIEDNRRWDRRSDKKHPDKKKKKPPRPVDPPGKKPPPPPPTVNEQLKDLSTQSGPESMMAGPSSHPAEPANADAVYTTGPGQAVEYNYTRLGTYSEDYAQQLSEASAPVPPIAGSGQVLTSGAANNPT